MTYLGKQFCKFQAKVCTAYYTQELDHEVDAQSRRQAKEAAKWTGKDTAVEGITVQKSMAGTRAKGKGKAVWEHSQNVPIPKLSRKVKLFNFHTYKFHALGDYVASILRFGTTDSYSTEPVSHSPLSILTLTQFS